ncbi:hypothetical protein PCA20602_02426 [Pandoraea capi]|uniref:Uncharacterized protein n=1 Tax=Pandoraea capi TaxID=2508286 RepID=A0ABY6W1Q6_9BURK|nr:hypothetical protein PCA20602_02426 [Pandoraea capi]
MLAQHVCEMRQDPAKTQSASLGSGTGDDVKTVRQTMEMTEAVESVESARTLRIIGTQTRPTNRSVGPPIAP